MNIYDHRHESRIIGARVYPGDSKKKCEIEILHCHCPSECVVLSDGMCIHSSCFLRFGCVYGNTSGRMGYTKRALKYRRCLNDMISEASSFPKWPGPYRENMTTVGEYVYLSYPHITMNKDVPFVKHSVMSTGMPFIYLASLDAHVVKSIVNFHPRALAGGEITSYQSESVPKFLTDMSKQMPHLLEKAGIEPPCYPSAIRMRLIDIPHANRRYKIEVDGMKAIGWDGEQLYVYPQHSRIDTSLEIVGKPILTVRPSRDTIAYTSDYDLIKWAVENEVEYNEVYKSRFRTERRVPPLFCVLEGILTIPDTKGEL